MSPGAADDGSAAWAPTPQSTRSAPPRAKKRRINYACNFCRSRKTRCDEERPACAACKAAGVECVTTNLRNPSSSVVRHEAGRHDGGTTASASASACAPAPVRKRPSTAAAPRVLTASSSSLSPAPPSPRPSGPPYRSAPVSPRRARVTMPVLQQARGSTYCEILSDWVDLSLYRLGIRAAWPLPAALAATPSPFLAFSGFRLCPLPGPDTVRQATELFLAGPNTLFPVLAADAVAALLDASLSCGPDELVRQAGYPSLLLLYVVVVLGAVSPPQPPPDLHVRALLDSCATLVGHVLQETTPTTVTAMLLLAMAQRCCNKVMASWNTMSLAVTAANTIGLSRVPATPGGERSTLWRSLCTFDRMLAFELGRSSRTPCEGGGKDGACAYPATSTTGQQQQPHPGAEAAAATESLAMVLDDVSRRCIDSTMRGQASEDTNLPAAIYDKIKTTGEAVISLMDWARGVPYALSPTIDLIQDQRYEAFESFLSLQYHNAIILLTRNSLLIGEEALHRSVDETATGAPWESVIRSGQTIAANAARKILHIVTRAAAAPAASGTPCILPCVVAPLHAIIALSMHVVTGTSRDPGADHDTLRVASDALRATFVRGGDTTAVESLLSSLETMRLDAMRNTTPFGPQDSPETGPPADPARHPLLDLSAGAADPAMAATPLGHDMATLSSWQDLHDYPIAWPDQIGWDWSDLTGNFGDGRPLG